VSLLFPIQKVVFVLFSISNFGFNVGRKLLIYRSYINLRSILSSVSILLFTLSFSIISHAEEVSLKFKQLSKKEGLSQSYAFGITQDANGFIWIATEDGLNRYDGENFVHYRHDDTDANTVASNNIRKVFIDKNDTLWVGTDNGVSRYNKSYDNFTNFANIEGNNNTLVDNLIWDIFQDTDGFLWVSTATALHKFNSEKKDFISQKLQFKNTDIYRKNKDKLTDIKTIFQDKDKLFWLGTFDSGIFLYNSKSKKIESLQSKNNLDLIINANSLYDMKYINSQYWLATDNGLYIVSNDFKLTHHFNVENTQNLVSNNIRSIEKVIDINDRDNIQIWIGSNNGLNIYDSNTGLISALDSSSLSETWVLDIFNDIYNNIWVGTYGGGINKYNSVSTKFKHYPLKELNQEKLVQSFTETSDGAIWFITESQELNKLTSNNKITKTPIATDKIIYQIFSDNDDNIWLHGEDSTLFKFSTDENRLIEHKNWNSFSEKNFNHRLIILNDIIWFINSDGELNSYNTESQSFTSHPLEGKSKLTSIQVDHDNDNFIWLTSESSLVYSFNVNKESFINIKINNPLDYQISKTTQLAVSTDWIWLGSNSQGIALINRKNSELTIFNENKGLSNNNIGDILIDNEQYAWLSTNQGISVINPNTNKVNNFGKDFNLTDNEFITLSALTAKNGLMYLGSSNGFYQFNPKKILLITQEITAPQFTKLLIANKKIEVRKDRKNSDNLSNFTLPIDINKIDTLLLKYDQSPFSIEFKSPNLKFPNQVSYRYHLRGLENNWVEAGKNNSATYTNISAGDYIFEVEVYDDHNKTLSEIRTLAIRIQPPWWLSKIAIVIYALITLSIISYFLQQLRHKRLYHLQIKQSEERLKLSLWGSGDEMWDWNISTGKIYRSNIWGILEFPQDGRRNVGSDKTNIHEQDLERVTKAIRHHVRKETSKDEHFEATYRVKDKDEKWIWILDRGKIVERDESGEPTRMTGTLKDISQIKQAEGRLKLFAKCIENISDAVVIYDRRFVTVDVNKAYQRITGRYKKQVLGTKLAFSQYPVSFGQNVKKHLIEKGSWHGEIESKRDDGKIYFTDLNIDIICDENGNISHFVGVFSDITKRKETEQELRKLANSDTLTGLPNRSYFQMNQTKLVNNKVPHALLVFDLDNFKKINDSMGHQVGDLLLCKVAERILQVGRKQDTVYRLGGDEFSIIIEDTNDIHTITTIAKEILRTIAQPMKLRNQEVVLYSSIGIVLYPEDGATPHELLKNADTAMYHAKDSGGNKYQFFSDSMNKKAVKRLQVENLIRHGLKQDYFSVFYQPKIEISTGKVAGMEALVRFEHPTKGIVSPVVFIPVSEETGQIIDIGEVVLRKSCIATKKWVDSGLFDGRIAVNLSAVQFTQPNLVELIADILKESGLAARYLELEITEGTVMDNPQAAIETMLQIRAMGIHLSLDDFGTGYSSLAYLKKFPLNTLKIDKAFVDDIEQSEQGRNMVATIVTIAHNLDLHVVAEGVETNQQLHFLAGLRCEQMQGYLYSKPLPEKQFQQYLLSHKITDKSTTFSNI